MTQPNDDHGQEKLSPEKLGEQAIKFATDTAYAAAGLVDLIATKARELYEQQRAQLAEKNQEGVDTNYQHFLTRVDQFKGLMDEAEKKLQELSERGRNVVENLQSQSAARPKGDDAPGPFDTQSDAEARVEDSVSDPVRDPATEGGPVPPEGAESVRDAENN